MNEMLFAVLIATAQTPPDQPRQIEVQKKAMRRAAQSAPVKIIGVPTLTPAHPVPILLPRLQLEPAGPTPFLLRPMSEMEKDL
jgi:hypothetical protein